MKKRFLALLLILSMVLGCLTGCEDTPDGPPPRPSPRRRLPPIGGMTMPVSGTLPCLLGICLMKDTTSRTFTIL